MGGGIIGLLILGGITVGVIAAVRRVMKKDGAESQTGDVIPYLLLALAVGTAAFALAELAEAAFPGDAFIFDTTTQVAASLAALVVAGPIAFVLWKRQSRRRVTNTSAAGWIVYLAAIEAVFMTALAIASFGVLNSLLGDGSSASWANVVVFAGVVVFHEFASRQTPPTGEGSDLHRVLGSVIGLVMTSIGTAGVLYWLLDLLYGSLTPTSSNAEPAIWISFLLVGVPIWGVRWWSSWPSEPDISRKTWLVVASVAGLVTAVGTGTSILIMILLYLFSDTDSAATHFAVLPGIVATASVAALVWAHHKGRLGIERNAPVQIYGYTMAAIGLSAAIGGATGLATLAFAPADFINEPDAFVISVATILVVGLLVWGWFWTRAQAVPRELEAGTIPRRLYLVGFGVITGLVAAGALIGTLVVLFQMLIGGEPSDSLVPQASLFIFSGLATWHLLRNNAIDSALVESPDVVTPFDVTLICSHPGTIATAFPKEARLKVIYRADTDGVVTEGMEAAIVEEVGNTSSLVWVEGSGYRIARARG